MKKYDETDRSTYIPLITKHCIRKVYLTDIVYIMKKQRKILIATTKEQFEFYERFETVSENLDNRFFRCLQHLIINLENVERMENQNIYFCNGETIGLGRDNYVRARQRYGAYLKKLL